MKSAIGPIVLVMLAVPLVGSQSPPFSIVSSVKPSADVNLGIGGANFLRGDTFRMSNTDLVAVLTAAYGTPGTRILGGPEWIRQDRWDVEIKVQPAAGAPPPRTADVVQAMLRDRFKLDAAMETRARPVYLLRIARADGKLGPNLQPSTFDCTTAGAQQQAVLRASGVKGANGQSPCATRSQLGIVSYAGFPIRNLLPFIPADRVIRDETGITGPVDLHLTWTHVDDPVADQASLYAAIREQLGLRLESATAPLDVLVIKSVSRPAAN
jgi:uncharacterized protein (TIGR03435 family)